MIEEIPKEFWLGVEQFNQQEFYACHDTLESLWMEAIEPDKTFYQGVLQLAVALYHLSNHNWRGAVILLGEGINRLRHYQPSYSAIEVTPLLEQSHHLLITLQQAGTEQVAAIAAQVVRSAPIELGLATAIVPLQIIKCSDREA
ncbi:MAG: DUF309 domain-containing protein [Leptolyngbyaceae cyanobacterium SL_7_1]|nr:DUF309 domain-containing protein [Leptolyngbyaceae cyanobacterium SL_7_1]